MIVRIWAEMDTDKGKVRIHGDYDFKDEEWANTPESVKAVSLIDLRDIFIKKHVKTGIEVLENKDVN